MTSPSPTVQSQINHRLVRRSQLQLNHLTQQQWQLASSARSSKVCPLSLSILSPRHLLQCFNFIKIDHDWVSFTGDIPSFKLFESERVFAFLDIQPLSKGHAVSPSLSPCYPEEPPMGHAGNLTKQTHTRHTARHTQTSRSNAHRHPRRLACRDLGTLPFLPASKKLHLEDPFTLTVTSAKTKKPVAKRLAQATGASQYNILQNNGRLAHQVVDHVHFHMIPKPNEKEGLGIGWPAGGTDMEGLKKLFEEVKAKM